MTIERSLEARFIRIEKLLGFQNGEDIPETLKALSQGAVNGTVDLMQELSNIKFGTNKKLERLGTRIDELEGYLKRIIKLIKE